MPGALAAQRGPADYDPFPIAALQALDRALLGPDAPTPEKEAAAQIMLDELIDGELYRFYVAKRELERRLTQVCRSTRGTKAGAEALRMTHAAAALLSTKAAHPLLLAKTSTARAADAECAEATRAGLKRLYEGFPDAFDSRGD